MVPYHRKPLKDHWWQDKNHSKTIGGNSLKPLKMSNGLLKTIYNFNGLLKTIEFVNGLLKPLKFTMFSIAVCNVSIDRGPTEIHLCDLL